MAIIRNTPKKRKETDPIYLRLHILGKIEGVKARLLAHVAKKGVVTSTAEIDAMLAKEFALPEKSKG